MPNAKPRTQRPLHIGHERVGLVLNARSWKTLGERLPWGERAKLVRKVVDRLASANPNVLRHFMQGILEIQFNVPIDERKPKV